jgi:hypothetical protein
MGDLFSLVVYIVLSPPRLVSDFKPFLHSSTALVRTNGVQDFKKAVRRRGGSSIVIATVSKSQPKTIL